MELAENKLTTKLTQLRVTAKRTDGILEAQQIEAIERQQAALRTVTNEVDELRIAVEAQKITKQESVEEIENWNSAIEEEIAKADKNIQTIKKWIKDHKAKSEIEEREEQMKFEVKLHETKIKLQANLQAKADKPGEMKGDTPNMQAKLPKLIITRFNGSYTDWPRF